MKVITDQTNPKDYFAIDYFASDFEDKKVALQTLYFLLHNAKTLIRHYLKNHENRDFLLKGFNDKCQEALEWLKKENVENQIDWTDYVNGVNQWFQTAIKNGVSNTSEYLRLYNKSDYLFKMAIFSDEPAEGTTAKTDFASKVNISLVDFMKNHCESYPGIDYKSRRDALYKAQSKKKNPIKLPKLARPYTKGRENVYCFSDLNKNWKNFSRFVNLPRLKSGA